MPIYIFWFFWIENFEFNLKNQIFRLTPKRMISNDQKILNYFG